MNSSRSTLAGCCVSRCASPGTSNFTTSPWSPYCTICNRPAQASHQLALVGSTDGWNDACAVLQVVMMGFGMGGYVAAAFAAKYSDVLAGVLMGGCCHDEHNIGSQLLHRVAGALYRMCSYRKRSQVSAADMCQCPWGGGHEAALSSSLLLSLLLRHRHST